MKKSYDQKSDFLARQSNSHSQTVKQTKVIAMSHDEIVGQKNDALTLLAKRPPPLKEEVPNHVRDRHDCLIRTRGETEVTDASNRPSPFTHGTSPPLFYTSGL